jgi:hypothetical protein
VAVRGGVEDVGILVRPVAVREGAHQRLDPLDARVQKLLRHGVGVAHHVHLRAVGFEELDVLLRRFGVNDADEFQAEVGADLRQPDAHVAGAGFDDDRLAVDVAFGHGMSDDAVGRAVFNAAAGVEALQLAV